MNQKVNKNWLGVEQKGSPESLVVLGVLVWFEWNLLGFVDPSRLKAGFVILIPVTRDKRTNLQLRTLESLVSDKSAILLI